MSNYTMQRLGALVVENGIEFRVWAMFADDVKVVLYDGNVRTEHPMSLQGHGIWAGVVKEAKDGQQYMFLIDGNEKADPRANHVVNSASRSIIDTATYQWKCNDFIMPPWNEILLYQLHPATFPDKYPAPKDLFNDIAADLWYLQKLGVNAIQLLPTAEYPLDISCGYNPAAIYAVESYYGGPQALKKFIDAAHARGIAVLLDIVINHISPDGPGSIWQFTKWNESFLINGKMGPGGGQYFYQDWRAFTPWGERNRPDYGRQEVRDFLRDNIMMWLLEFRIDGFRFDSVVNIRNVYGRNNDTANDLPEGWSLLQDINSAVNGENRNVLAIAEDLQGNCWITKSIREGGAGFGSQWDSTFLYSLREMLIAEHDEDRNMFRLRNILCNRYDADAFHRTITDESHDAAARMNGNHRLAEIIGAGDTDMSWFAKKRTTLGAVVVYTAPGIPMILQGNEILEWRQFGDDRKRDGVDWGRFCGKTIDCHTCMQQSNKCSTASGGFCDKTIPCSECPDLPRRCEPAGPFSGIFMLYKDLAELRLYRKETRGLRGQHINVYHVNDSDKVIAYTRVGDDGCHTIVLLNFGNHACDSYRVGLPCAGLFKVRFNSDFKGYDPSFQNHGSYDTLARDGGMDGFAYHGEIGLGRYSAVILSL